MAASYELMDLDSGNVIIDFDSEDEARTYLRSVRAQYGSKEIASLCLFWIDGDDQALIAMEDDLLTWIGDREQVAI